VNKFFPSGSRLIPYFGHRWEQSTDCAQKWRKWELRTFEKSQELNKHIRKLYEEDVVSKIRRSLWNNFIIIITRLEMCTLWSTLKFQKCSLHHITSDDVSRATKEKTDATMVSMVTVARVRSEVIVATMLSKVVANLQNVINVIVATVGSKVTDVTGRHTWTGPQGVLRLRYSVIGDSRDSSVCFLLLPLDGRGSIPCRGCDSSLSYHIELLIQWVQRLPRDKVAGACT
jgi:hypothetical protein